MQGAVWVAKMNQEKGWNKSNRNTECVLTQGLYDKYKPHDPGKEGKSYLCCTLKDGKGGAFRKDEQVF